MWSSERRVPWREEPPSGEELELTTRRLSAHPEGETCPNSGLTPLGVAWRGAERLLRAEGWSVHHPSGWALATLAEARMREDIPLVQQPRLSPRWQWLSVGPAGRPTVISQRLAVNLCASSWSHFPRGLDRYRCQDQKCTQKSPGGDH